MVAEANYGGRVTDANDRITIKLILEDFYNEEMLKKNHKLVPSGKYIVPPEGEVDSYRDYLMSEDFPLNDLTEIFGLHDNAEITSALNITKRQAEEWLRELVRTGVLKKRERPVRFVSIEAVSPASGHS